MKLHSLIIDDFFEDGREVRDEALKLSYEGVTSPFDGVFYPNISLKVPGPILDEMLNKLSTIIEPVKRSTNFIRLSTEGTMAPHQAHTDKIMGKYTALIYLNEIFPKDSGTTILEHSSGLMASHPKTKTEEEIWARDTNDSQMWKIVGNCPMKFNRLFVIDSELFHRSEPVGGFGSTIEDGRLVLISFFN